MNTPDSPKIGTLQEHSLHRALKAWYARPGDGSEVRVDGYVVDLVRTGQLIEIQSGNFGAIRNKLEALLERHRVRLLYPVSRERWIVRQNGRGLQVGRRKSPKRGDSLEVFGELVRIPKLITHPRFSLEVLLIQEEVILRNDGKGSWRRKRWSIVDRQLLGVLGGKSFETPADFLDVLPENLPQPFTNHDLADALGCAPGLAGKISYTLRGAGLLLHTGRRGRAYLFERIE